MNIMWNDSDMGNRKLAYVEAYEQLYKMIADGTFPAGSKLPSEPKLAEMLGVSRMTLRKSLGLLHDDALIKKIQGAGTFVADTCRDAKGHLEAFGMPVYNCCDETIDRMELEFRLEVPNSYITDVLKRKSPVIVSVDRWYFSGEMLMAYTFTTIPIETISEADIDLNNKQQLEEFVEVGVYEKGRRSTLELLQNAKGGEIVKDKVQKGAHITLILENVYGEDNFPLLSNKHYIVTESSSFVFNVYK